MTWTRTPQEFPDRADVLAVSRSARWLLIEMYSWSNAQLTNGRVPRAVLRRISDADDAAADVAELLREGLAAETEDDPGFLLLDWSNQEDAETVRDRAARNAEKTKRARERKDRHLGGDHSMCVAPYCKLGVTPSVTGNVTPKAKVTTPPSKGSRHRELTGSVTPLQSSPVQSVQNGRNGMDRGRGTASAKAPATRPGSGVAPPTEEEASMGLSGDRLVRYRAALASHEEALAADAAETLAGLIPAGGAGLQ